MRLLQNSYRGYIHMRKFVALSSTGILRLSDCLQVLRIKAGMNKAQMIRLGSFRKRALKLSIREIVNELLPVAHRHSAISIFVYLTRPNPAIALYATLR